MTVAHAAVAWSKGLLEYRLRHGQLKVRRAWEASRARGSNLFYEESHRRRGKSTAWLLRQIEECLQFPKTRHFFFAPVKEGLWDYVRDIIDEALWDCPEQLRPKMVVNKFLLQFANGSELMFRGANMQQHRFRRGNDIKSIVIDEARDIDDLEDLIDSVALPSLFSKDGWCAVCSTPADREDHPLKDLRDVCIQDGDYFHSSIMDSMADDPDDFPADKVTRWEKKYRNKPSAWAREYMALWVRDEEKAIVPAWSKDYEVSPVILDALSNEPEYRFWRWFESVDFGIRDTTVVLVGFYHYLTATLYIVAEYVVKGSEMTTTRFGDGLTALEKKLHIDGKNADGRDKVYLRVADSDSGSQLLAMNLLESHGIAFYPTDKERLHAMVNKVNVMVAAGRVRVSSDCPFLLGSLQNCQWDDTKLEFKRSKAFGHADAIAALVYQVRNLVDSDPIPGNFRRVVLQPDDRLLEKRIDADRNHRVLKDSFLKGLSGQPKPSDPRRSGF
jgi:hypothetical protein